MVSVRGVCAHVCVCVCVKQSMCHLNYLQFNRKGNFVRASFVRFDTLCHTPGFLPKLNFKADYLLVFIMHYGTHCSLGHCALNTQLTTMYFSDTLLQDLVSGSGLVLELGLVKCNNMEPRR